jgi:hypothetical protein
MDQDARLTALLARIDALNAEDPNAEQGEPRELVHARRLTHWVLRLNPGASETLRIAARGQHVRRWTMPRDQYPQGRAGYLRWRETLKTFHADTIAKLMGEAGYPAGTIDRVRGLMSKRGLGADPDTQTLEDALCLVFLELQFAAFRHTKPDDKIRDIVRKTWAKMSEAGRAEALKLPMSETDRRFVAEAVRGA